MVAFPSTGSAAAIAGQYLRQSIDMPLVGHIPFDELSGVAHVQDGLVTGPIRVFAGNVACHLDKPCDQLYLVTSPVALPAEMLGKVAEAILRAFAHACAIVSLDSVSRQPDDDIPDVYAMGANAESLATLKITEATPMGQAIFTGMTAELMHRARDVPVACLAVEATPDLPDGRAAAALIAAVDKLIPHVKVDSEPLRQEAQELEKQLESAVDEATSAKRNQNAAHTFI